MNVMIILSTIAEEDGLHANMTAVDSELWKDAGGKPQEFLKEGETFWAAIGPLEIKPFSGMRGLSSFVDQFHEFVDADPSLRETLDGLNSRCVAGISRMNLG